jgi:hypothetical protein
VRVNGIPDEMDDLLVLAPSGFVVNLEIEPGDLALSPAHVGVGFEPWGPGSIVVIPVSVAPDGRSAVAVFSGQPLPPGTFKIVGVASDVEGNFGNGSLDVAIRDFPNGAPPIGSGQQIWLDFAADRDAVPGPDFAVDLQHFGLASASAPELAALAEAEVVSRILDRLAEIYHEADPAGLGALDPVEVTFTADPPAAGDVTRICVGGQDPSGGVTIGSILIDPNNANRNSVECATLPPTGIFPRELLILQGEASFQATFDPLRPAAGGVPVGADPWDALVLSPDFDPSSASEPAAARWAAIDAAFTGFADALGTIIGHEAGHALGLVPEGPPGAGLFGGSSGAQFTHDVLPGGGNPPENFVMNAGNTFNFARLAGLAGQPLADFRPLDHAYLRDRVVLAPKVTALLPAPVIGSVSPATIVNDFTTVTVSGSGFAATPALRCLSDSYTYNLGGESWVSASEVRGNIFKPQVPPGVYDLELENPDGQKAWLPDAISVP